METRTEVGGAYEQTEEIGLRGVRALHANALRRDRIIGVTLVVYAVVSVPIGAPVWMTLLAVVGGVLLYFGALEPRIMQVRMLFRRNPQLRHRVDVIADDAGLTFRTTESQTHLDWSRYHRLLEGPDIFVLVYGKDLVHFVPTEAFSSDADREAFRRLARATLPDRRVVR